MRTIHYVTINDKTYGYRVVATRQNRRKRGMMLQAFQRRRNRRIRMYTRHPLPFLIFLKEKTSNVEI